MFLRRAALVAALGSCAIGAFGASAQARTTPAGGAGHVFGKRALAYVQPLNESESGTGTLYGGSPFCSAVGEGSVSGSPISSGVFLHVVAWDCTSPGPCIGAMGFVELGDSSGEIVKEETGSVCVQVGATGTTLRFRGSYTILAGYDAYDGASGSGSSSATFVCQLDGSCSFTGHEGAASQKEGPFKKGDDPTHVLLCSPTLVRRSDGTIGNALQVPWLDYAAWLKDAKTHPEIPAGSIPAKYGQGVGLTCDNLPGYRDSGTKVDEQGTLPTDQTGPLEGAIYPYWVKT
ncbi:MAG TPA: hypothetical protein VF101_15405 [Gaiellaceae bacterium]